MKQLISIARSAVTGFIFSLLSALISVNSALAMESGKGLTPMPANSVAPALELEDLDGNLHKLSDYRGKVVIVNFWATWCPPCRAEMPSMQRAWNQLQHEGVIMLAVDVGEDEETIFLFTADYPVEFPLLMDKDSEASDAWPILGLPTTYIVDVEGNLAYRAVGGREWDDADLMAKIRELSRQSMPFDPNSTTKQPTQ